MKKVIALIMAMVLMACCAFSASAFSPNEEYVARGDEIAREIKPSFDEFLSENSSGATSSYVDVILYDESEVGGYYLISFNSKDAVPTSINYRMGIYAVEGEYTFPVFADGYAVYTIDDKQWHPLSYLYTARPKVLEELAMLDKWGQAGITRFNFVTTYATWIDPNITVVTTIQKYLADIDISGEVSPDDVKYLDVDNSGEVDIKDATALQKYVADIEISVIDSVV